VSSNWPQIERRSALADRWELLDFADLESRDVVPGDPGGRDWQSGGGTLIEDPDLAPIVSATSAAGTAPLLYSELVGASRLIWYFTDAMQRPHHCVCRVQEPAVTWTPDVPLVSAVRLRCPRGGELERRRVRYSTWHLVADAARRLAEDGPVGLPPQALRYSQLARQVPAVQHIAFGWDGDVLRLWAVTEGYDVEANEAVFARELRMYEEWPDTRLDFRVVALEGRPLASAVPHDLHVVWTRPA